MANATFYGHSQVQCRLNRHGQEHLRCGGMGRCLFVVSRNLEFDLINLDHGVLPTQPHHRDQMLSSSIPDIQPVRIAGGNVKSTQLCSLLAFNTLSRITPLYRKCCLKIHHETFLVSCHRCRRAAISFSICLSLLILLSYVLINGFYCVNWNAFSTLSWFFNILVLFKNKL